MIKKYKYIALAVAGIAFASCTSTYEPDAAPTSEEYICFAEPTVNLSATLSDFADNSSTRSVSSWTSINEFQVWGFCVPNDAQGNKKQSAANQEWDEKSTFFTSDNCGDVFHNMTVSSNSGNGYCLYNIGNNGKPQFKLWNDVSTDPEALYTFIAGYTRSGKGNFEMEKGFQTNESGKVSYGPKLIFSINRSEGNLDTPLNYEDQPDALLAEKYNHKKSDGRVSLSFMHFMTGIRFKFHNFTTDKVIKIKKVTYSGKFHRTATFDFTTEKHVMSVSGTYAGTFTLLDGTQPQTSPQSILAGSSDYLGKETNPESGEIVPITLLLLPNPAGTTNQTDGLYTLGSDKEIKIVYTLGDDETEREFSYQNFTLNYIPKPNTLHTAHFNFIGDEFVVMFQADDKKNWENGSDNTVTIN